MTKPKAKSPTRQYVHYYDADGKRHTKAFSAHTSEELAYKLSQWSIDKAKMQTPRMPLSDAVERYIQCKAAVLSPTTVTAYKSMAANQLSKIGDLDISAIDEQTAQRWVNDLAASGLSAKTVINCFALLTAALRLADAPGNLSRVKLPRAVKYNGYTPSDADIKHLLDYTRRRKNRDLYRAILLGAFCLMRRGEICALTGADINGCEITINKSMAKTETGTWVIKPPKTTDSARTITAPQFVIDEIAGIDGRIIQCDPDDLHDRFARAIKFSKSPKFRFHDLRHYGASIMHALNISDIVIQKRGGWKTPYVLRRVYINAIDSESRRQNEIANSHFCEVVK